MKIILNRRQARDILDWCKTAYQCEQDEAHRLNEFDKRAAKTFYRKAKTWRLLSTQIREGLKIGPSKRKSKTSVDP